MNHLITRRSLLAGGAALASLSRVAAAHVLPSQPDHTHGHVVELFTSQGCSTCPPADSFALELAARPDVMLLTYHVDYWDYLGWKDTLGRDAFSRRQYEYARQRGDIEVYTPQMIVDGKAQYSGVEPARVRSALGAPPPAGPRLWLHMSSDALHAEIDAAEPSAGATLWLLPVDAVAEVTVSRGENAGKTLRYCNVVRDIVPAGLWKGEARRVILPREPVVAANCTGCIALLQEGRTGSVLSVASCGKLA